MQYVSEIDQFLRELQTLPGVKSNSRIDEEQKYKRIFALRDIPQHTTSSGAHEDLVHASRKIF